MPCSDQRELHRRAQQLFLDCETPRPAFQLSPPSPQSPLPWESPKLRPQHSYMNPTASSMAKSSRSTSLGEGIYMGTPPRSPSFPSRRISSGEVEVEPPLLTSPTVTTLPPSASPLLFCPPSNSPSVVPPHCSNSPIPSTQNIPPSRIPLPKQPLSARRSLCLEVKHSSSWSGASAGATAPTVLEPGCGISGNRQGWTAS